VKRSIPDFQKIPDKIYFRIGEVSKLVGVDTHVLRYWETEFTMIKPFRGKSKQRLYRRQDVENLLHIKVLLHDEGYTISGARKYLKNLGRTLVEPENDHIGSLPKNERLWLQLIKTELHEILEQLNSRKQLGS
jgi:DNA-binding transcriptional MerR regulator